MKLPCKYGEYKLGDHLPEGCKYFRKPTFRAVDQCPRCILYKSALPPLPPPEKVNA